MAFSYRYLIGASYFDIHQYKRAVIAALLIDLSIIEAFFDHLDLFKPFFDFDLRTLI